MILVSIGYSSCHWCHVMEKESFEDSVVADFMNEHFVCIKVDREERPDVDDVYMTACQLASGGACGWPLNAFAMPDGRPVWAGTYFPKSRWLEILDYFRKTFEEEPEKMEDYATRLAEGVRAHGLDSALVTDEAVIDAKDVDNLMKLFMNRLDPEMGGRQGAPKFPMPNNWDLLMHYAYRTQDKQALQLLQTTLDRMMMGGLYDQLEGGFARYSTDAIWLAPHFEKMLYDNGQLVSLYANAYALTGDEQYKKIVDQTLGFVDEYWSDPSGGFYSSFDADSEGEEGKFYVWSAEELMALIPDLQERDIYFEYYAIEKNGNWEEHKNILFRRKNDDQVAKQFNLSVDELLKIIHRVNESLIAVRKKRIAPGLDDKILASWNALMLQGYIDAYRATQYQPYLERAIRNANFLKTEMIKPDFRMDRNFKNGKSTINAFLDDYALTIRAFTSLYEVTFDQAWLDLAKQLSEYVLEHFDGGPGGLFYYTSDVDPPLVARRVDYGDNVIPSANSIMARNLFKLGELFYDTAYINRSTSMFNQVWPRIQADGQPSFYSNWCQLMLHLQSPPFEVVVIGNEYDQRITPFLTRYTPDAVYLGGKTEGALPLLAHKFVEGETMIYVCRNKVCKLPTSDPSKALALMRD